MPRFGRMDGLTRSRADREAAERPKSGRNGRRLNGADPGSRAIVSRRRPGRLEEAGDDYPKDEKGGDSRVVRV